ncbi:hypothetical protein PHYC_01668 [Phycisphaerales bacterium]|nr:hypothetical protein PHYC_01668 [Phycisphaerales bacterium]
MKFNRAKAVAMLALVAAAGGVASLAPALPYPDPYANLPGTITLTGTVRDFKERTVSGGHGDFERQPTGGFALYVKMVQDQLGSNGKPVMRSAGYKLTSEYKDSQGRPRIPNREYIASRSGDVNGAVATSTGGALTTAENFDKWFTDVPGVNLSRPLSLTMVRQANSNVYTFNDRTDAFFAGRGGFFPINGELWGNSGGTTPNQNFHFTYELNTSFVYERGHNQAFTFTGDDDVWVFIDNKLVIDIGGVHAARSQTIELDRLNWLVDGQEYNLNFFFAERHRTQSNFRIDTTMVLRAIDPPATSALFD